MADKRYSYEIKTDKRDRRYGLKTNLKTGKKQRVAFKSARKSKQQQEYRQRKADIQVLLDAEGAGATYQDYQAGYQKELKRIPAKRKKEGKKPLTKAQIRGRAKRNAIEYKSGLACRYKYMWEYWLPMGEDKTGKEVCDPSPVFSKDNLKRNGSKDYEAMVEECWDEYVRVREEACKSNPINGGAYAVLYDKGTKQVIDQYELPEDGKGKGDLDYSFTKYRGR